MDATDLRIRIWERLIDTTTKIVTSKMSREEPLHAVATAFLIREIVDANEEYALGGSEKEKGKG